MITGVEILSGAPQRVVGADEFIRALVLGPEQQSEGTLGRFAGEVVVDPDGAWITISDDGAAIGERKLTLEGAATGFTDNGKAIFIGADQSTITRVDGTRTINLLNGAWYENIPFDNINGETRSVYVGTARVPVDVTVTRTSSNAYAAYADLPGFVITPDSVSTSGNRLTFGIDAALTALGMGHWTTTNTLNTGWSMRAIIWLDDSQTGVRVRSSDPEVAIVNVRLMKAASGGAWVARTEVGSALGQLTPSTTPEHYKIAILGPLVTDTDLDADPDWVKIGTVTSATGGETYNYLTQVRSLPYGQIAAAISTFNAEHHDDDGRHGTVTADTVESRGDDQLYYGLGAASAGVKRWKMFELDKLPRARMTTSLGVVEAWWELDNSVDAYRMRFTVVKGADDTPTTANSLEWRIRLDIDGDLEHSGVSPVTRYFSQYLAVNAGIVGAPAVKERLTVKLLRRVYMTTTGTWFSAGTVLNQVDGLTPGGDWGSGGTLTRVADWNAGSTASYGSSGAMTEGAMPTAVASNAGSSQYFVVISWTEGDPLSFDATVANEIAGTMLVREVSLQYRMVTAER